MSDHKTDFSADQTHHASQAVVNWNPQYNYHIKLPIREKLNRNTEIRSEIDTIYSFILNKK